MVGLAIAVGGVVFAGVASADTDSDSDSDSGSDSSTSKNVETVDEFAPAGVPLVGLIQSAVGATKVLPGGQGGPGY